MLCPQHRTLNTEYWIEKYNEMMEARDRRLNDGLEEAPPAVIQQELCSLFGW
jgi:hypothetical protein